MKRPYAILCEKGGDPVPLQLMVRESESAPGRLKVIFVASAEEGLRAISATDAKLLVKPSADAKIALGVEFRLEMN